MKNIIVLLIVSILGWFSFTGDYGCSCDLINDPPPQQPPPPIITCPAPVLVSPINGDTTSLEPQLSWKHDYNFDCVKHGVELRTLDSLIYDNSEVWDHSVQILPGLLSLNTTYYWRVRSYGTNYGWGEWSETWSFTTINNY